MSTTTFDTIEQNIESFTQLYVDAKKEYTKEFSRLKRLEGETLDSDPRLIKYQQTIDLAKRAIIDLFDDSLVKDISRLKKLAASKFTFGYDLGRDIEKKLKLTGELTLYF